MTRLALLLGDPVAHSLSPVIHNIAFRTAGIDAVYHAARTPPHALEAAIAGLRRPNILGANVTIPHKQVVADLVDALDATAAAVGALNVIVREEDGSLRAYNTDVAGFTAPLDLDELEGASVVVLGSGGAARAAGFALLESRPVQITFAARSMARAEMMVRDLATLAPATSLVVMALTEAAPAIREAALVVNATPVGMHPHTGDSPVSGDLFREGQTVYDLIYNPRPTLFLREAAARGARTVDGLEMLLGQAAVAFRLWTGVEMPLIAVRQALLKA
jgi:shikimate dehydrogenase